MFHFSGWHIPFDLAHQKITDNKAEYRNKKKLKFYRFTLRKRQKKTKMELLMWVVVYVLLIVINGTMSSKLDNEHEVINLENVLATNDEKISEDYQVLKGK